MAAETQTLRSVSFHVACCRVTSAVPEAGAQSKKFIGAFVIKEREKFGVYSVLECPRDFSAQLSLARTTGEEVLSFWVNSIRFLRVMIKFW